MNPAEVVIREVQAVRSPQIFPLLAESVGIPMMSITQSDLMPISAERSDAGLSQCERVIGMSQDVL
jgi:hypothetical protein